MTTYETHEPRHATDTFIFCLLYIIIIFIALQLTSVGQTKVMLMVLSLGVAVVTAIYALGILLMLKGTIFSHYALTQAVIFFVASELAVLTLTGTLPLFGLLTKMPVAEKSLDMTENLMKRLFIHRQKVALTHSIAGAGSAFCFILISMFSSRRK
ncbi:hypothetical protein [Pseudochryseolinea flava]|uniref:Uncharacterized protein n=1 Tax=Pseudochryseolinea flava TaxID=2059302 RepID=A0A364Y637_9BACT|nr:hypothetical protein [Pseudochryseolinea flava]RAW02302.1 hypothetical protein DQQ10_07145 [Pseudochryseolinea flava]